MNRQELQTAASIGLLYLVRMLGLFMVLPVLPLAGRQLAGATPALIGLALGVYGLSQALLQIPMGLLSDKYGRKKVILAGLCLFVAGSLLAAFSTSIYGVIAGRLLQGCGAIASSLLALMSDLTRVDNRSKSMAIIGISIAASFGLALIFGPLVNNHFGLQGVFLFAALSGLGGILVLVFVIPAPAVRSHEMEAQFQKERILTVLKDPGLLRIDIGIFMTQYILMSCFVALPLIFENTHRIPDDSHHLYYLVTLTVSFLMMAPLMRLADDARFSRSILLFAIVACMGALVGLGYSVHYYPVLAAVTLFFMGFNLLEVILPAQVSKIATAGTRGTAMGVYSSSQFAGIFAGGAAGGLIISHSDISTLMYVNAALCFAWLLVSRGIPRLGDIASRTFSYDESCSLSANQLLERLSSIEGVLDVALIEDQKVVYLKVDRSRFDDRDLAAVK